MATKKDLDIQREIVKAAEQAAKHAREAAAAEQDKVKYQKESLRQSLSSRGISKDQYLDSQKRAREEAEITKQKKEQAKTGKTSASLTQKINKLLDSGAGSILKQANLTKTLEVSMVQAKKHTGEQQKGYNLISEAQLTAVDALKSGTFDATEFMDNLEEQFESMSDEANAAFGSMRDDLDKFAKAAQEGGKGLEDSLNVEAKDLDGLEDARNSMKKFSAIVSSPKLMGAAAIGIAVKLMKDFASKALDVRQSLGTTAVESVRLAGNMTAAGVAAKVVGGSSQEAEAAVTGLVQEFGSLSVVSAGVSAKLGLMTGQFGISGANAAKLLKSMEAINGASIETNINLISSVGALARAEGVAPAQVLNDIAESTEEFALFAKGGGENIAKAAIEARKLGLNLGTVAGIAENLLDFESSIEKEMEASMLLGRQLNLDKARELALTGNLAGLAEEIKNQVGSQAEFEAMNVVERKALAAAIGVNVADLGKIVAGEKTSAELAEEKNRKQQEFIGLEKLAANAAIVQAVASIFGGFGKWGPLGMGLGAAAVLGLFSAIKSAPKLLTGGTVKETGMAEVHRGEVFSGTKNEAGFGTDMTETNGLLKQSLAESKKLREQNSFLMDRLTNRVDGLALSN